MISPRHLGAVTILALALATAGCSASGSDDADTTTTRAGRATTTTAASDRTTTTQGGSSGCAVRPVATEPAQVPTEVVTYRSGSAVVSLTPEGGTARCLELELKTDGYDENQVDPADRSLDVTYAVDEDTKLNVSVSSTPLGTGKIDAFVRIDDGEDAWLDSMHTECTVTLHRLDDKELAGSFTCDSLTAGSADGKPAKVEGSFGAAA